MKAEAWIFTYITIYFLIVGVIYGVVTYNAGEIEWAGTVALLLTGVLGAMIAGSFWLKGRKIDPRPEENKDAEVYEGAGEYGFFPPQSMWPFWCAAVVALIFLGPAFGWWLTMIGFGVGIWAVSGLVFEYYRGDYAH